MSTILFSNSIGPVPVAVTVREGHTSELGITNNPVESGVKITDHAYVEPKKLTLDFADDNAATTYNALVRFQESRQPFQIVTGLYVYKNMLVRQLTADRDVTTARVLKGRAELQEIIIVSTAHTASEGDPKSKGTNGAKRPSAERSKDAATKDRASGTVMRGDTPEKLVPLNENRSILHRMFGS